jgi:hypothetical protein
MSFKAGDETGKKTFLEMKIFEASIFYRNSLKLEYCPLELFILIKDSFTRSGCVLESINPSLSSEITP